MYIYDFMYILGERGWAGMVPGTRFSFSFFLARDLDMKSHQGCQFNEIQFCSSLPDPLPLPLCNPRAEYTAGTQYVYTAAGVFPLKSKARNKLFL